MKIGPSCVCYHSLLGTKYLLNDPAWLLLMSIKDIIELVVCPVHNEESIAYLDSNISEH